MTTGLLAALSLFAAFMYLSGNRQAVQGFAQVSYPQQLGIILGIGKLLGTIALIAPGVPKLKEWAYAGFTFASTSASVAHYLAKDGPTAFMPLLLLLFPGEFTSPHSLAGTYQLVVSRAGFTPCAEYSMANQRAIPRVFQL